MPAQGCAELTAYARRACRSPAGNQPGSGKNNADRRGAHAKGDEDVDEAKHAVIVALDRDTSIEKSAALKLAAFQDLVIWHGMIDKRTIGGRYTGPPPTIAHMRSNGVKAVIVRCGGLECHQKATMTFDAIGLPDSTPFPDIATARKWVRSACGSRKVLLMPDWPDPRAGSRW